MAAEAISGAAMIGIDYKLPIQEETETSFQMEVKRKGRVMGKEKPPKTSLKPRLRFSYK